MTYLSEEAGLTYDHLTRLSLWSGVIGPDTFLGRLSSLRDMLPHDTTQWQYCDRMLRFENWGDESDWPEDDNVVTANTDDGESNITLGGDPNDPSIIYFIPAASSGLSEWEFHKGDADPYPSVPHGHWIKNDLRKLDPYRGFITKKGKPDGRVSRKSTIALWNDEDFRKFATKALEHFIGGSPDWRGWRVVDPLRLPMRRRWKP